MPPASVTVVRLRGDQVVAERAHRAVHPQLRGLVPGWFGYREEASRPVRRRQVPGLTVTVFFGFGPPPRLSDARTARPMGATPMSFLAGPRDSAVLSESAAGLGAVQAELTPLAAYSMFGVPMHEVAGEVVDLADVLGRRAGEISARLAEAADWPQRFALLDDVLTAAAATGPAPDAAVAYAWRCLRRSGGRVGVAALADTVGCSRRHLSRRFRQQVGLAPKAAARVLRLQRALRLLRQPHPRSLAEAASACGYYDQAHLNLDFRAIVGCSPTAYLAEEEALRRRLAVSPA